MLHLHPGEKLELTVRKHWLVFVLGNLHLAVLAVIPLLFGEMFLALISSWPFIESLGDLRVLSAFFYAIWLLLLWVAFAVDWTDYYLDVWQVTTERLIDVEQKGMFNRDEATTRLESIQDITVETSGILGTFLDFGNIKVQTAGESREFIIRNAAGPERVRQKINSLVR